MLSKVYKKLKLDIQRCFIVASFFSKIMMKSLVIVIWSFGHYSLIFCLSFAKGNNKENISLLFVIHEPLKTVIFKKYSPYSMSVLY